MKSFLTRTVPRVFALGVILVLLGWLLDGFLSRQKLQPLTSSKAPKHVSSGIDRANATFFQEWEISGISPTPAADRHTLARRLSLALTGSPPSLEEIRRLEALPAGADPVQSWLDYLFSDRRYADYMAERFARAFVGVETGPFLVYRRRRLVTWLADELAANRKYDELVHSLIAAEGLWTSHPETNFLTVTLVQGTKEGPDDAKLAARTSRTFLGISLDCVQCHDDKFSDQWKQEDFHQFAAWFTQAQMTLTGVREQKSREYETRYLGDTDSTNVSPKVPYAPELLGNGGSRREQLADWVTNPGNTAFARAAVNRVWAMIFGRPLVDPVDDIPLTGPYPPGLEELATLFTTNDYDLQYLIRVIAGSAPFLRDSRSAEPEKPVTEAQEQAWACFPVTPLRPEQIAGSIIQGSTLQSLDSTTHIFQKFRRFGETNDFVKRYGDPGEDEFAEESGTIPQRLLLMNGKLVRERIEPNSIMNSSTRIARYSSGDNEAIETAFLAVLSRRTDETERTHFSTLLADSTGKSRETALTDLYWALINSTEFSWNR